MDFYLDKILNKYLHSCLTSLGGIDLRLLNSNDTLRLVLD